MTVPAAAAWIGVPSGIPMSMPGWNPPQRGPNGLVIGPCTGQMSPAALGVATVPLGLSLGADVAARILASIAALAAWIAADSRWAASSWALVSKRACFLLPLTVASLPWL